MFGTVEAINGGTSAADYVLKHNPLALVAEDGSAFLDGARASRYCDEEESGRLPRGLLKSNLLDALAPRALLRASTKHHARAMLFDGVDGLDGILVSLAEQGRVVPRLDGIEVTGLALKHVFVPDVAELHPGVECVGLLLFGGVHCGLRSALTRVLTARPRSRTGSDHKL